MLRFVCIKKKTKQICFTIFVNQFDCIRFFTLHSQNKNRCLLIDGNHPISDDVEGTWNVFASTRTIEIRTSPLKRTKSDRIGLSSLHWLRIQIVMFQTNRCYPICSRQRTIFFLRKIFPNLFCPISNFQFFFLFKLFYVNHFHHHKRFFFFSSPSLLYPKLVSISLKRFFFSKFSLLVFNHFVYSNGFFFFHTNYSKWLNKDLFFLEHRDKFFFWTFFFWYSFHHTATNELKSNFDQMRFQIKFLRFSNNRS